MRWDLKLPLEIIAEAANRHDLDPDFLKAVIQHESGGNPWAIRAELRKSLNHLGRVVYWSRWKWYFSTEETRAYAQEIGSSRATEWVGQAIAWGLMQIQGTVARERGFTGWYPELCNPSVGIEFGCRHLRKKFVRYGPDLPRTYAAYNAGRPSYTAGGMFKNQRAVDSVMRYYRELKQLKG